ncbi:unnamed protein product [Alternaria alternata]
MGSIDTIPAPEIKTDIVIGKNEVPKPPVADDFMYDFKYNHPLPTTEILGIDIPADCNAQLEAEGIVEKLSTVMRKGDANAFADLFLDYGESGFIVHFHFLNPAPKVARPYSDFAHLQFVVSFETDAVVASAVINSVLTKNDGWKIYTMHTVAEELIDHPEVPPEDGHMTGLISWEKQRALDVDAADPEVLIIGGGQK